MRQWVRATRAYIAGFGTAGSLLAGAAILFVLASALVSFKGWPSVAEQSQPVAIVSPPPPVGAAAVKRAAAGAAAQASAFRAPVAKPAITAVHHIVSRPAPTITTTPVVQQHQSTHPATIVHQRPSRVGTVASSPAIPPHPATPCRSAAECGVRKVTSTLGDVTSTATGGLGTAVANTGSVLGAVVGGVTSSLGSKLGLLSPGLGNTVTALGAGLASTLTSATGVTGGLGGVIQKAGQLLGTTLTSAGQALGTLVPPATLPASAASAGVTGPTGATGATGLS